MDKQFRWINSLPSTRNKNLSRCERGYWWRRALYFAKVDGVVRFERKGRNKKQVSVYPVAQEA